MIFLTATKDLQDSQAYEQVLKLLGEQYGEQSVTLDRDLFESYRDWRKRYKQVYGVAEAVYILARQDGTVGLGIWKQWKYISKQGIPMMLMLAGGDGTLASTAEYETFRFERIESNGDGEDLARFATAKL